MNQQERDLLTNLVTRLRQAPPQDRDQEAEGMISDLVRDKPDTPYVLAQTVLIQDYALHQAQARIADLEQQLQGKEEQRHESGGFLSAIFGSGKPAQPQPRPQPTYQPQPSYQPQPGYAQPAAGPWGQAPVAAAPTMFAQQGAPPSFLRSAATTAAGIAGGALLFEGIESLFGGHGYGGGFGGGGFGGAGFMPQPGITETVVNNYYDTPTPGAEHADFQQGGVDNASFDQGGNFDQGGDVSDASFDTGGDFGGDDFGGGGGDDFV